MKNLLMFRSGVHSAKRTLSDGNEHTLYFLAKTPAQIAAYGGLERRVPDSEKGDILREEQRAEFIATSLCDEAGTLLMTKAEALLIPATLKPELCHMILDGSNSAGEAGNV